MSTIEIGPLFVFPEDAAPRDKLAVVFDYPRMFVQWCRTRVGLVPNYLYPDDGQCVMEQYLFDITGIRFSVSALYCIPMTLHERTIITPRWVQSVIELADNPKPHPTYNELANALMLALERNELA
jgi:hypothetical protein